MCVMQLIVSVTSGAIANISRWPNKSHLFDKLYKAKVKVVSCICVQNALSVDAAWRES